MYTVEKGAIRIGLRCIKGVTPTFYDALKQCRKSGGKWKTLFDMAASAWGGCFYRERQFARLLKQEPR